MNKKTKLIATIMAMCLVVTLGVIGIFAVKTLNMSVGGNITFTADGIAFEVSAGEFKTESGVEYTGITSQTGKLQGFAMNTNTKLSDIQDKIDSWAGLDLVATETQGDPVLHFSITNLMEDEILSFDPKITLGTNINDNMEIIIEPAVANIQETQSQDFTITFHVKDTSINAGLTGENYSGFAINILLSTALVVEPDVVENMTFAPTSTGATTYKVSNCSNFVGDVEIPAFVKQNGVNYPVTEIAGNAFKDNTNITSITIPNTVTTIGSAAFQNCSNLTGELRIPDTVTTLKGYAFYDCTGLTSLKLGKGVKIIGNASFGFCSGLTGELIIPDGVEEILQQAFYYCSGLTGELVIPDSVKIIGNSVFRGCSKITSLKLGKNIESIGDYVFADCTGITNQLTLPKTLKSIGERTFASVNMTGELIIPSSVESIGIYAFVYSNISLIKIENQTPILNIGENCFANTNNCPIYVPNESYLTAEGWDRYASRMVVV